MKKTPDILKSIKELLYRKIMMLELIAIVLVYMLVTLFAVALSLILVEVSSVRMFFEELGLGIVICILMSLLIWFVVGLFIGDNN